MSCSSLRFGLNFIEPSISGNFAELFEGGFEVFDSFVGENVGVRKIKGLCKAIVSEPEYGEPGKDS
jgi:hypothetical protein